MKWPDWWPWFRRPAAPDPRAKQMLERAQDMVRRTEDQEGRVQEVTRRADEVVRRTGRFTQEVDRALHIRGTP